MENINLTQGVKELRKRKGFSQEVLATKAGLSLRTVQRVENGETKPTGDTLTRICTALNVTPEELMEWGTNTEPLRNTIKTKYEYLHIFDSKLLITKTPNIDNLVEDYRTFTNYFFRTLIIFLIFIPIFSILAVFLYNEGMWELTLYLGAAALAFLLIAIYNMLFTSGTSYIKMKDVKKIQVRKQFFFNSIVIKIKEGGRIKTRGLMIDKKQLETTINTLLSERLIEEKDVKNQKYIDYISIIIFMIVLPIISYFTKINIGVFIIILPIYAMGKILVEFIKPLFEKS